jgi:hypothetical protein
VIDCTTKELKIPGHVGTEEITPLLALLNRTEGKGWNVVNLSPMETSRKFWKNESTKNQNKNKMIETETSTIDKLTHRYCIFLDELKFFFNKCKTIPLSPFMTFFEKNMVKNGIEIFFICLF